MMNRREFSRVMAGAAVCGVAPCLLLARQSGSDVSDAFSTSTVPNTDVPNVSAAAAELYRRALVLDCNSAPPYEEKLPLTQADLDMVRESGVNVVKSTLGSLNASFADTVKDIGWVQEMIELHPAYFLQVRVAADMTRAKREGKMGIILSFESAEMLEGKLENFEVFRNLGVRVMQMSYNKKSPFGAGVMEPNGGGLTPLGREAVAKMNALGIAVDLSHANAQTTADAMATSKKPVIMTHAGCAAVHAHPRNKTDAQLRALAEKGGVVGIYTLPYLTASPKQPTVDDYMAHMEHALKVAGEEHVGVGTDGPVNPFDTSPEGMAQFNRWEAVRQKSGLAAPEEDRPVYVVGMNMPRRIEVVADQLLKRGYSARVAEKVLGGNFARVLGEIWGD